MSNVTGLVFKSHFRLNIIIFIRNVICHGCLGPLKARNLDDVKQHCYKWGPVRSRSKPSEDSTATNAGTSVQMDNRSKTATNERPSEETRSNGRELQMGAPPKTAKNRRRGQPSAEEDNRPPRRTTVRRGGQPSAEEDNRPPKRTTENWTLSNRRRTAVHWNRRRTTVHWNSTLTMGDTSIGIEGRRTEMTIGCRQRTKWPTRRMAALRIGSSTTDG